MDLALPKIEPARSYAGAAADAIDRAGAQFKGAADKVAGVLTEDAKARIAVESQEATIQATKGLNDVIQTIQTQPYVTPEQAQSLFGGEVPGSVDLTEPVPGQPDEKVRQPRKVIPMHEIAPALFEQRSRVVVTDAARNVRDEPWRRHFERAAAQDVERKRAEMMDWQRAQFLTDMEIRSVSQFHQAMAARNYPLAEAVLNGPGMGVRTRGELRAKMPEMRTKAVVEDRLRAAQTPEELDKLISDIAVNRVTPDRKILENPDGTYSTESTIAETDPKTGKVVTVASVIDGKRYTREQAWQMYLDGRNPALATHDTPEEANVYGQARHEEEQRVYGEMRGKYAKLTPEEQYQFKVTATHRKNELVNEQIAAQKRVREGLFQKYGNVVFEALKASRQTGLPASRFWSIAQISAEDNAGMDFSDKMTLLNAMNADPKRETDPATYLKLATIWQKPGALGKLPPQTMWGYLPSLSAQDGQTWMDRWAQDRNEPGAVKSPVTEAQMAHAGRYVEVFLNTPANDKPQEFEIKKGAVVQMLVDNALSPNPKPVNSAADIAALAAGRFDDSRQKMTGAVVLRNGLAYMMGGAGRVTDQTVAQHEKQIKEETPLIDEAYKTLVADATPSDEWRARVHLVLANPKNLQQVKARLHAEGKNPEDKKAQVFRITQDLRPVESEDYARGIQEDAEKARAREQVRVAAEKKKAEEDAAREAKRAVEAARRQALPWWEQKAEDDQAAETKRRFEKRRWELRQQIGLDPIDQTPFQLRTSGIPSDYGRADTEAERQRSEIEQQVTAEFEANKRAFRDFLKRVDAGDPVAVAIVRKYQVSRDYNSGFKKYSELRRKGEIP